MRNKLPSIFKWLCLGISIFLFQGGLAKAEPVSAESEQQSKPVVLNPLASALGNDGVVHCQGRVQQVADFLSSGMTSGVRLLLPPDHINDHLISASIEVFNDKSLFYASMDFAPLVAYGCDASFETIMYWENKCEVIAKTQFKAAKPAGMLRQFIQTLTYGDSLQIFLMPAGNGCVSIKKQGLFDKF